MMKVMIRVPNWVGDAVMAEPALRQLRHIFKDAHITFVARPWVAGLFEGENLHDDIIPVADAKGFTQSLKKFSPLTIHGQGAELKRLLRDTANCGNQLRRLARLQVDELVGNSPVLGWKTARRLAKQPHAGGSFLVARLDLAGPKIRIQAYRAGQSHLFLKPHSLLKSNISATPDFFHPFGTIEKNHRKFSNHEGLAAKLVDFGFNVALHDAHGGHHDDN